MSNKLDGIKGYLWKYKWELIIFIYTILSMLYVLNSAFMYDDGTYYFLKGEVLLHDSNINEMAGNSVVGWITGEGRFFPLSVYSYYFYYFLSNPVIYHTVSIVSVGINVLMFGNLVGKITGSRKTKLILMTVITLFFQIYTVYHNTIISYHMYMQILFALFMLILIYSYKYMQQGKKSFFIVSIILFTASLLMYEMSFVFIIILFFFILAFQKKFKKSIILALPYMIPLAVIGIINIIVKMRFATEYEGISTSFEPYKVLVTGIKQSLGVFPLSNYIFQHGNNIISPDLIAVLKNVQTSDILIAVIFGYILYRICKLKSNGIPETIAGADAQPAITLTDNKVYFGLFSWSFYLLPGALIAISQKYQHELHLGIAHISVYIQYFGLLLVFYWIFTIIYDKLIKPRGIKPLAGKIVVFIGCVLFIFITLINQQNTRLYIDAGNDFWLYPKNIAINAVSTGILNDVNENDIVFDQTKWPWVEAADSVFLTQYANKKIHTDNLNRELANMEQAGGSNGSVRKEFQNTYIINYYSSMNNGIFVMGQLVYIEMTNGNPVYLVKDVKIYNYDKYSLMGTLYYECIDNGVPGAKVIALGNLPVLGHGSNAVLYGVDQSGVINFNSVKFITW